VDYKSARNMGIWLVLAVLILMLGCGDQQGSVSFEPYPEPGPNMNYVLFLPDTLPNILLSGITGSTYTYSYSGNPPAIEIGYALAGSDGNGYVREVIGVEVYPDKIELETQSLALEDLFNNVEFSKEFSLEITPDMMNLEREV